MANWIPVIYAVTGSKTERDDLLNMIRQTEQLSREKHSEDDNWTGSDLGDLAKLLGSDLQYSDLLGYWYWAEDKYDAIMHCQTEDGEDYFTWTITFKHWENPKLRELIEGTYPNLKIYYQAPAEDTNDTAERYFHPSAKLTNIDGLNYHLRDDGTATLNADNRICDKVLHVPEQVEYNNRTYIVDSFGDVFADPQYGSPTEAPTELEEIFFPATVKTILDFGQAIPSLRAIHFASDVDYIGFGAFYCCQQLTMVDFGGKVGTVYSDAFFDCPCQEAIAQMVTFAD